MRYHIFTCILLAFSNTPAAAENLNLELLCEGTIAPADTANISGQMSELEPLAKLMLGAVDFEKRVSIKNNEIQNLYSKKIQLSVYDTSIELHETVIEMFAAEGVEISGNLDRLTGALNVRLIAPQKLVDENGGGADNLSIQGTCQKLDPTKKLF